MSSLDNIPSNLNLSEIVKKPRTKFNESLVGISTGLCEIVNPDNELPVSLSTLSQDLESQTQVDCVKKKTQSNVDVNLSTLNVNFF